MEIVFKINLNQTISELREQSKQETGDGFTYDDIIIKRFDIYRVGMTDTSTFICVHADSDISLYINENDKIADVLSDLGKHVNSIENPKNYKPEKAGKLQEFLDFKLNKDKIFKVEL